jgi:hypothetical protein
MSTTPPPIAPLSIPPATALPPPVVGNANGIIEHQLDCCIRDLETAFAADCLTFIGDIANGIDDVIRDALEERATKRQKLVFILETTGGYIEVTQRIAETLRKHYPQLEYIVPNYAMSAGTVLVMSGDAIHMDYYSILGPIDPQVQRPGGAGGLVPALGYLVFYDRLIDKSKNGQLTTAELAFLVEKFDPAELYRFEQAKALSVTLLKEWLAKYKFKNWVETKTRKVAVTDQMRTDRAEEIGEMLTKTDLWHSHGRGISMEILKRDVHLEIEDFGADPNRHQKVRVYYKLLVDYMQRRGHVGVIHWDSKYAPVFF